MSLRYKLLLILFLIASSNVYSQNYSFEYCKYLGREFAENINQRTYYYNATDTIITSADSIFCLYINENLLKQQINIRELNKFQNVRILNLHGHFSNIEEIISAFPKLNELSLLDIYGIDWELLFLQIKKCKDLKSLIIESGDMRYIPNAIESLNDLERLEISNIRTDYISNNFLSLTKLKYLRLSNLDISLFPNNYRNNDLQYMDISYNRFDGVFGEIQNFPNLTYFNFSGNKYYSKDDTILCKIPNLKVLSVEHCGIESFPKKLMCLPYLEDLFIGNNRIVEVPDSLTEFKKLKFLDWSGFIGDRKKLEKLRKKTPNCQIWAPGPVELEPIFDTFEN